MQVSRPQVLFIVFLLALAFYAALYLPTHRTAQHPVSTPWPETTITPGEYPEPTEIITIKDPASAALVRDSVVDYIWPETGMPPEDALPTILGVDTPPNVPNAISSINPSHVSQTMTIESRMHYDYRHLSYVAFPQKSPPNGFIILHQGHQGGLGDGLAELANRLLKKGYAVALMQMPLVGWNSDNQPYLPGFENTFATGSRGHDQLYAASANVPVSPMQFFVEPIIKMVNLIRHLSKRDALIGMVGLSGGGWATHLASAIDPRITLSFPVAGSYPLYLRPHYPGSEGDAEQVDPGLYQERASWLDLYVLGAYGPNRAQHQILNKFDPCCFYGDGGKHYSPAVSNAITKLGSGHWELVLDETHRTHSISPWAADLILDAIGRDAAPEAHSHYLTE